MTDVCLKPLEQSDREQFIKDNQEAFNYGAMEEFGIRDDHFEEDDQIISRETIEKSIDEGEAYRIISEGKAVGGAVIKVEGDKGDLSLLFVSPNVHSKGRILYMGNLLLYDMGFFRPCWRSGGAEQPLLSGRSPQNYLVFSASNFFMNSTSFSTPSIGIAL